MAADILLYKTDLVPVGKDQKQHVELTQFLAEKFNKTFGQVFKIPKPLIPKLGAKIMSLQNPKKKMSKTDDPEGCIEISEDPKEIKRKIKIAVTDSEKEIRYDPIKKPGISNLLLIYSLFSGEEIKKLERKFQGVGYEKFKENLAKLVIKKLEPIREKRERILKREVFLRTILEKGRKRAEAIAKSTMEEVKMKMGFLTF
jgi:tryptophanyl-tRNA synthetase